ncbi:MAG: hypothetical protein WC435_01805 [Candidatus Paceibacterota bacterium]
MENNSQKEIFKIFAVLIIILVLIGGAVYWYSVIKKSPAPEENLNKTTAADIPALNAENLGVEGETVAPANATESIPNLNPAGAANPFSEVYKNPFE